MANRPRDTYRYTIREGNRIRYIGITDNPKRRAAEHTLKDIPGDMRVEGPRVSRETAEAWERNRIATYWRRNGQDSLFNERLG